MSVHICFTEFWIPSQVKENLQLKKSENSIWITAFALTFEDSLRSLKTAKQRHAFPPKGQKQVL